MNYVRMPRYRLAQSESSAFDPLLQTVAALKESRSEASLSHSETLVITCRRCNRPTENQTSLLWCLRCRRVHRRRGQTRGLAKSLKTRRLKAWLKNFPHP